MRTRLAVLALPLVYEAWELLFLGGIRTLLVMVGRRGRTVVIILLAGGLFVLVWLVGRQFSLPQGAESERAESNSVARESNDTDSADSTPDIIEPRPFKEAGNKEKAGSQRWLPVSLRIPLGAESSQIESDCKVLGAWLHASGALLEGQGPHSVGPPLRRQDELWWPRIARVRSTSNPAAIAIIVGLQGAGEAPGPVCLYKAYAMLDRRSSDVILEGRLDSDAFVVDFGESSVSTSVGFRLTQNLSPRSLASGEGGTGLLPWPQGELSRFFSEEDGPLNLDIAAQTDRRGVLRVIGSPANWVLQSKLLAATDGGQISLFVDRQRSTAAIASGVGSRHPTFYVNDGSIVYVEREGAGRLPVVTVDWPDAAAKVGLSAGCAVYCRGIHPKRGHGRLFDIAVATQSGERWRWKYLRSIDAFLGQELRFSLEGPGVQPQIVTAHASAPTIRFEAGRLVDGWSIAATLKMVESVPIPFRVVIRSPGLAPVAGTVWTTEVGNLLVEGLTRPGPRPQDIQLSVDTQALMKMLGELRPDLPLPSIPAQHWGCGPDGSAQWLRETLIDDRVVRLESPPLVLEMITRGGGVIPLKEYLERQGLFAAYMKKSRARVNVLRSEVL